MAEKIEQKSLIDLLKSTPPGGPYAVADFTFIDSNNEWTLNQPAIQMYCYSESCMGYRFFDLSSSNHTHPATTVQYIFMTYKCRNCRRSPKTFALRAMSVDPSSPSVVIKMGEFPFFGSQLAPKILSFLGGDRELFVQGQRAENSGFGIGAFSYYKKAVENQKGNIIREIAKIAQQMGATEDALEKFAQAENDLSFEQATAEIGELIPQSLMIHGQNPLNLLCNAFNEGIHAENDADCLEIATGIRVIMTELTERLSTALHDNGELSSAVNRLLNSQKRQQSTTS